MINEELLDQASNALAERAQRVRDLQHGGVVRRDFPLNAFTDDGFERSEIRNWAQAVTDDRNDCPVIYRISASDIATRDTILRCFDGLQRPLGFGMTRSNRDNRDGGSLVLYVGSSHKIGQRMREHLQSASPKTYALHLCRWCRGNGGHIRVELQSLDVPALDNRVQDIEDALWDSSCPLFGKRGGR